MVMNSVTRSRKLVERDFFLGMGGVDIASLFRARFTDELVNNKRKKRGKVVFSHRLDVEKAQVVFSC